jgi:DNA helicase-2/ATP-dependent DNA helicase PcrA
MAKGLEFDAVISYNNKESEYEDKDKYLYYVACTRAQHNLVVYNEPTKIKKIGGIK